MSEAVRRLIEYYESDMFVEDFKRLEERDPLKARVRRWYITDQLNANLSAAGIKPTEEEYRVQQLFASGDMPMDEMLDHMKRYVASIAARWQR